MSWWLDIVNASCEFCLVNVSVVIYIVSVYGRTNWLLSWLVSSQIEHRIVNTDEKQVSHVLNSWWSHVLNSWCLSFTECCVIWTMLIQEVSVLILLSSAFLFCDTACHLDLIPFASQHAKFQTHYPSAFENLSHFFLSYVRSRRIISRQPEWALSDPFTNDSFKDLGTI